MDYDLNATQQGLIDRVDVVIDSVGGLARALNVSVAARYDPELDAALERDVPLDGATLLERVLVAERLAELGVATTFGVRAVVGMDAELPAGGISVATADRRGPVRYGALAENLAVIDGADVVLATAATSALTQVRSGFGYPYARLGPAEIDGSRLRGAGHAWRSRLTLVTAAEIAGNATRAVARTAEHMKSRKQFGQTLSTFQALRHRLADAAVSADATRWLVREAAYTGDARDIDLAAAYAAQSAAALVPELVQMCGARSFTLAFGLHVFTMRLGGLRLELGGPDRLAHNVLARATHSGVA